MATFSHARGVILCGVSAGSLCWFAEGVTAFHGTARPYTGLGILPWSNTVHYHAWSPRGPMHAFRMRCTNGRVARKPLRSTYLGGGDQPPRLTRPSIVLAPEPATSAAAAAG